jgi:pilus assembly protein CpaB
MKGSVVTGLMLTGVVAAGSGAAWFTHTYIDNTVAARRAEIDSQYEPVRAVVANADLRPGTFLSSDAVAIREIPRAFLHSEAVLADDWGSISGRALMHTVRSGEPVLLSHLTHDATAGFSAQLAQGMRALTFPVDDESSISGMLAPGDRVDIFFTTNNNNESMTLPLLYDVPVIATGIRTRANESYLEERSSSEFNTITVSVTPDNAARITLAQEAGKITVTLRQPQDEAAVSVARVTKTTLLHGNAKARGPGRRPVEIIIGGR